MAVLDTFRPAPVAASRGLWNKTFGALRAWNDARVTRNALSQLSARELADIGLERADLDQIIGR